MSAFTKSSQHHGWLALLAFTGVVAFVLQEQWAATRQHLAVKFKPSWVGYHVEDRMTGDTRSEALAMST